MSHSKHQHDVMQSGNSQSLFSISERMQRLTGIEQLRLSTRLLQPLIHTWLDKRALNLKNIQKQFNILVDDQQQHALSKSFLELTLCDHGPPVYVYSIVSFDCALYSSIVSALFFARHDRRMEMSQPPALYIFIDFLKSAVPKFGSILFQQPQ